MMAARLSRLSEWTGGSLHGQDVRCIGVSTDSRSVAPGQLFIALPGERVDGHDFVATAQAAGAAAALVARSLPLALPQLVVGDTVAALSRIARHWLKENGARRIGITGSNGKTTVKTLTAGVLAQAGRTYANPGNRNNEIGLPLAALELGPEHAFAVFEMGAGKPGDIEWLCSIAPPQIGLVNNIAPAHLERLGSIEGVAQTKAAIYRALPTSGVAVIPADDDFAPLFRTSAGHCRRVEFGLEGDVEVRASAIQLELAGSRFCLHLGDAPARPVTLSLSGRHNVRNALAAAAIGHAAGLDPAQIVRGLETAPAVAGRLQRETHPAGWTLLDDSYNANPGSFRAGLEALALAPGRRWVAMGQMAELGPGAATLHAELGALALKLGVGRLYAVGELSRHAVAAAGSIGRHFPDQASLIAALAGELERDVTLLVKGSRSAAMDLVVAALRRLPAGPTGVATC